ncbi:MAG: putative long chain acyl-CoA synthase [Solirubrobacteraceae bacterium]|nr:putative long chain acyl-CoA synthase [Solirubrobacteraceae bacterium]
MGIGERVARIGSTAQNVLEVARFGGLETGEVSAPYAVVARRRVYRLRHYFPDAPGDGPPVLLVPPLMLSAEVYDVAAAASAVRILRDQRADPWVVDFGAPEHEEGGLERTLADHVLGVSDAIDRVREATGRDVHLAGYSQGGMFCYQTAAYRRSEGIASLITFGAPVDLRGAIPLGLPEEVAVRGANFLAEHLLGRRALPAWASSLGFRLLDPAKSLQQRLDFLLALHDREALLPRENQRRFLMGEGFVAWPGPALADFMRQFLQHNRMLQGGFTIEDRLVTLADIDSPILTFVGEVDEIAPADAVRPIRRAAPRPDVYEVALRAGHFGLVVGSRAKETTWPVVAAWARHVDGEGEPLPDSVRKVEHDEPAPNGTAAPDRLRYGLELVAGAGVGAVKGLVGSATGSVRALQLLTREAVVSLPRLARLNQVQPDTRVSLAQLLGDHARRAPSDVLFLYEDRAYSAAEAERRVDNVVLGLLQMGVREGEPVGVLMGTRPSGLATLVALNRIGAVAVMLRGGEDTGREAHLAGCARVIADPAHAEGLRIEGVEIHPFLLDYPEAKRDPELTALEVVDPRNVKLPAWYRPNDGRARDLAFVLFTGEGERTRQNRITNGRWALSAFGTASAAALTGEDTVFCVNPLFHPSGLLTSVGGALAGGSRLAMAANLDPETFWDEARRYGITAVAYTWSQLGGLVEAPPHPAERGHPVRLFIGSGMPQGMWRRVEERFAPARVLEFWASTEGEAILANVRGSKRGSLGRPLPGSAELRIARYDQEARALILGEDGLALTPREGEPGLLLARLRPNASTSARPLRGVFARGDAWLSTETLFSCDEDGDHWLYEAVGALLDTPEGVVAPQQFANALSELECVDLAAGYGLPGRGGKVVSVAALTLRDGDALEGDDLTAALAELEPWRRPAIVRVVDEMPRTPWYRPLIADLREQGVPLPTKARPAFVRSGGSYRKLTKASRDKLLAG